MNGELNSICHILLSLNVRFGASLESFKFNTLKVAFLRQNY